METLGCIGEQLQEHVAEATIRASEKVETPLFDINQLNLGNNEKTIYDCLSKEPLHIDQLITETDLAPGNINAGLISLRLKGLIKQLPGSQFLRR